jgi:hypothetical protein
LVAGFDINFGEVFQQAANLGADILVWPSAMQTPDPFTYGYARLHQYHLIAVGHPGDVVDKTGAENSLSFSLLNFPYEKRDHLHKTGSGQTDCSMHKGNSNELMRFVSRRRAARHEQRHR